MAFLVAAESCAQVRDSLNKPRLAVTATHDLTWLDIQESRTDSGNLPAMAQGSDATSIFAM